ncbi:GDSL esterase/lipase At5g03610-like [Hordeum vulgare subsp. vulgare]|uniref:GDSL esterase/lipase At5g03610-like n=1 Tax=Hordeum vulgare subsp. vulgare TaxID=112509 RepID=UPI001D1A3A75|nr:GDSL esterase/lipase At5g03610-like [Hordeum vulgare subsp. vulgare]
MKLLPTVFLLLLVFLALDDARVEARGTPRARGSRHQWSSMFVFGDDFVDNGNVPDITGEKTSRQWSYPYGSYRNSSWSGVPVPTGRFSNYRMQSDFIGMFTILDVGPPSYEQTSDQSCDSSGMTFAVGGAGVFKVAANKVRTLAAQVQAFKRLVNDGVIETRQLHHSVALIAISGNDYMSGSDANNGFYSSFDDLDTYMGNVVTEILDNVAQLQTLGVRKTSSNNYTTCDLLGNYGASVHNKYLKQMIGERDNVHILDLYTAFTDIVNHAPGEGSDRSKDFKRKLTPCCESSYKGGYCGKLSSSGKHLYDLCQNPDKRFYWDETHPTHAGWEAVMEALEQPLMEFLDQDYVR